jgi:hypothetical protein
MRNPGGMYLQLSEGPDDLLEPKWSPLRFAGVVLVVIALAFAVLFIRMPGVSSGPLKDNLAIASKGPGKDGGGDDDSSGPGSGGDDDDDSHQNTADTNTGTNSATSKGDSTRGQSDKTRGDSDSTRGHSASTRGHTGHRADVKTGHESKGNTDRPGAHTGASTKGETDPGDKTGKTERR